MISPLTELMSGKLIIYIYIRIKTDKKSWHKTMNFDFCSRELSLPILYRITTFPN